jgi:hypothetical protein
MSPDPIIRGQAVVSVGLLVGTILLGAEAEGLACAGAVGALGFLLWLRYRGDVRSSGTRGETRTQRARLDVFVAGDLRLAVAVPVAVGTIVLVYRHGAPSDVGTLRSVLTAISIVWSVIYLSSLVDWYVVLPRISGQLGFRPCRAGDADHAAPRYPKSWRETTRVWYLHRLVTALVVRYGISYAATLAISGLVSFPLGSRLAVVGGLSILNAYGPVALLPIGREAFHVRIQVGQTVRRIQTERVKGQWRLGPLHLSTTAPDRTPKAISLGEREYVYDVSAEGVDLVSASGREREDPPPGGPRFVRSPTPVRAKDMDALEPCPEGEEFRGCENGRCSGINWYCVENPEAFDQK